MPRFTVKELLITITFVAFGLAMLGYACKQLQELEPGTTREWLGPFIFVASTFVGLGLGTPFHRRLLAVFLMLLLTAILGMLHFEGYW